MTATGRLIALLALCIAVTATGVHADEVREPDVGYIATPPEVVDAMLDLADVGPGDTVYDLGSGDGRIPIAAVRDFGARRGVGVEIDPALVEQSRVNAREAGVAGRTRFIEADIFDTDFSAASVVTLYLFPQINRELRPRILSRLEPGTRVVSHDFGMGQWQPDAERRVGESRIYLWYVPADVAGRWVWQLDGVRHRMVVGQQFQRVLGEIRASGRATRIRTGTIEGRQLRVTAQAPAEGDAGSMELQGRIDGDRLHGQVTVGGRTHEITAIRGD
jgi:SAM-dependent methyltransferase